MMRAIIFNFFRQKFGQKMNQKNTKIFTSTKKNIAQYIQKVIFNKLS